MKAVIGVLALGLLLGASGAEAGLFGSKKKLPRPIDWPVVRPKVQEGHKPGKRQRHPTVSSLELNLPAHA
ncbi:MAG TPA: hypothetical protein VJU18_18175 [Vicinamibacteria bacterium]|nr:hypothetical protein [Vicinamibacteria bacterium]